ncbi:unnamed protein product [Prunus brigantina]
MGERSSQRCSWNGQPLHHPSEELGLGRSRFERTVYHHGCCFRLGNFVFHCFSSISFTANISIGFLDPSDPIDMCLDITITRHNYRITVTQFLKNRNQFPKIIRHRFSIMFGSKHFLVQSEHSNFISSIKERR